MRKDCTIFIFLIIICCSLHGEVDNRFRDPVLNWRPFVAHDPESCTLFTIQPFFETARHSMNEFAKESPLYDYGVTYKLANINQAIVQAGLSPTSLIPTFWQGVLTVGEFRMTGHFETEGLAFHWYHIFANNWAVGMRGEAMHAQAHMELVKGHPFDTNTIGGPGDENELLSVIQSMDSALNTRSRAWSEFVLDDTELYVQLFTKWTYCYKCRFMKPGLTLGLIFPTSNTRTLNDPAAVPVAGDGHWGVFVDATLDAILRYDLRAGLWMRFQKRLPRTDRLRVPTALEPPMFGAVIGNFRVDPGLTFLLSPYLIKEGLREGFGLRVGYTFIKHFHDTFEDQRANKTVPVNLGTMIENSSWGLDYVTAGFLYDFAYGKVERSFEPVVSLLVDVPLDLLATERAFKTYGVSLILEASF